MLDRHLISRSIEQVRDNLVARRAPAEQLAQLDELFSAIEQRRVIQAETDQLRADRNRTSKQIGKMMKAGQRDEAQAIRQQVREISQRLGILDEQRKQLTSREQELLLSLPNMLHESVADGKSDADNTELRRWGTPPEFDFSPRDHVAIGESLGIFDFERAAKLSGARFPVYIGMGARLERALISFFLDRAAARGYTEVMVPYIVSRKTMTGTGQLPKFEQDLFRLSSPLNGSDAFLIPTAEVPVTNLHAEEILTEDQLPISYCAFTPCFRAEAGSYGKDVRGLIRQHQFHKVELVKLCTPQDSETEHAALTAHAESLLQELGLHYRAVRLCSGDTSASACLTIDLEVYLPSQGFREISSCSMFSDFQARRMQLRYRPRGGGKPRICHTINGSGLAVGRTVVALLENFQNADGSVSIPSALQPYLGGVDRITVVE